MDIPVESLIHQHQAEYYQAIRTSTTKTDCAPFIEFMLGIIAKTLHEVQNTTETELAVESEKARVETQVEARVKTPGQILMLLTKQPTLALVEIAAHLGKSPSTIERAVAIPDTYLLFKFTNSIFFLISLSLISSQWSKIGTFAYTTTTLAPRLCV